MTRFVLDASFTLHWCFEDESTPQTEALLSSLQEQESAALVPPIWFHELLNGLGKGVARGRLTREKATSLWREIRELPITLSEVQADESLLELALSHNLAVYDASYLAVAKREALPLATGDKKLRQAAELNNVDVLAP